MYKSAIPTKTKRDSLLQEGIRRLRYMSDEISDVEKRNIMSKFANSLRISGYDHQYCYQLMKGIWNRQAEIDQEIASGSRIQYRSRKQILNQKAQRLGKYENTWFLRGAIQNTFKVQTTPDSALMGALRKCLSTEIGAEGGGTKFVELGGKLVTSGLSGSVGFTAAK